jgi:transposase-like protein
MVPMSLICPDCQSQAIVRFGKTTGGHARFRCKDCKLTFSEAPSRSLTEATKEQILAAYQERMSMRGVARTFDISRNTLVKLLKQREENSPN